MLRVKKRVAFEKTRGKSKMRIVSPSRAACDRLGHWHLVLGHFPTFAPWRLGVRPFDNERGRVDRKRASRLYRTIRGGIESTMSCVGHEFLRCFRGPRSTNQARIVASERVFARQAFRNPRAGNDLRPGQKTRPDKTRKLSSPSSNCLHEPRGGPTI